MNEEINKPLLSVIIPCYKVEKYIDRCLNSVVNQTYKNLEIILIDDGSPDNTGTKCDEWSKIDSRIRVIHKNNEGLGFARNSGLKIAQGEYFAFVDSDDFIALDMYEILINKSISTNSDIVYCGMIKENSDGNSINISDFNEERIFEKETLSALSQGFFKPITEAPKMLIMSVWHSVYKRSVIKHEFYSEREVGSEDVHFQISAVLNAERIAFIPNPLYIYCYNGESLSRTFLADKFKRYKRLANIINNTYSKKKLNYKFDYYVFVIAFLTISQAIANIEFSTKEKRNYIKNIVCDNFWADAEIKSVKLDLKKKVFWSLISRNKYICIYYFSKIYYLIIHKLLGKPNL